MTAPIPAAGASGATTTVSAAIAASPDIVLCGHGCGLPAIFNTDRGEWEHAWTRGLVDDAGQLVTLERVLAADNDHDAAPEGEEYDRCQAAGHCVCSPSAPCDADQFE